MQEELQVEHEWLRQLVGEWTFEAPNESSGAPEHAGTESVRTLGGMWAVCEARSAMADGTPVTSILSLGYDPAKAKYVGTFIGSMMSTLWVYEGELDETGTTLVLDTVGPGFDEPVRMARYKDRIEFISADERTLSSACQDEDGSWKEFMRMTYRRIG